MHFIAGNYLFVSSLLRKYDSLCSYTISFWHNSMYFYIELKCEAKWYEIMMLLESCCMRFTLSSMVSPCRRPERDLVHLGPNHVRLVSRTCFPHPKPRPTLPKCNPALVKCNRPLAAINCHGSSVIDVQYSDNTCIYLYVHWKPSPSHCSCFTETFKSWCLPLNIWKTKDYQSVSTWGKRGKLREKRQKSRPLSQPQGICAAFISTWELTEECQASNTS